MKGLKTMPEKQYVNGIYIKEKVFADGGSLLNISISKAAIKEFAENLDDKGYAKITIAKRKEADKYGNTHYSYYNSYEPKQTQPETNPVLGNETDDMPF